MKRLALLVLLLASPALAQAPSPAQMGITSGSPQSLQVLDSTKIWAPLGEVDQTDHAFTGYGAGTDVRAFGCKADGTDQTACFNNALTKANDCVIIPATPLGFTASGTITVARCMKGTTFNPSNTTLDLSGSSRINCNNQVAAPCVVVDRQAQLGTQIENITLVGSSATPVAGSVGFQWKTGYNLVLTNFQSANFDTCAKFGPIVGSGMGPISAKINNSFFSRCKTHYVVDDGVPELTFIGGRWGAVGGVDYPSADDFLYATKTTNSGAGDGPNGIVLDSLQLNTPSIGCPFRWGGFLASPTGAFDANKIVNTHVEINDTGYTGSATKGLICIDGTVPHFPGLMVSNSYLQTDAGATLHPTLLIDPNIPWDNNAIFTGNRLLGAPFTLTIKNQSGNHGPVFIGNYIQAGSSFVAGDTTAQLTLTNNFLGGDSISGQWNNLAMTGNFGVLASDTATGPVHQANGYASYAWTPALASTGAAFTYSSQIGTWFRTQDAGLSAYFFIALTSAAGATGNVSITGFPKTCAGHPDIGALQTASGFTGLTGTPFISWINGSASINLVQAAATGITNVQGSNLTNTTSIVGTVTCGIAQ